MLKINSPFFFLVYLNRRRLCRMKKITGILFIIVFCTNLLYAQSGEMYYRQIYIVEGSDTIPTYDLRPVHVFAKIKIRSEKEWLEYTKLVRDVKKAYPYARVIASSIIETYETMETLPDEDAKQKHLEAVEDYIMKRYKPELKKLNKSQSRILVKLVDRECNTSSYNIVKALTGSLKAGLYNTFAGLFGNSLKTRYDPTGKDRDIENIVIQIQEGSIDYYYSAATSTYYYSKNK